MRTSCCPSWQRQTWASLSLQTKASSSTHHVLGRRSSAIRPFAPQTDQLGWLDRALVSSGYLKTSFDRLLIALT